MRRPVTSISFLPLLLLAVAASSNAALAQDDWVKRALDSQSKKAAPATTAKSASAGADDAYAAQHLLMSRATLANVDRALARYRKIAQNGEWQPLPAKGGALKLGDDGASVQILINRLVATGDLDARAVRQNRSTFDKAVEAAVRGFQSRNGLTPSGQVNSYTRAALNVPAKHRLDQLIQNHQRILDLLDRTEGRRYVLVNIPSYELQAANGGRLELYSRVVLGKPETPTPVISAQIRALNTLPYWHVPQSIAQRALIPAIKKDPNYLAKQHIRVFASWGGAEIDPRTVNWWANQGQRYVFRQDPGPHNALGLLRLDMPNKHIVYMHDTPLKQLYDYHLRPYSAGCVRVQTVVDVGEWLLRGDGHAAAGQLRSIIQQGQKQTIKLDQPVDVHFVYISAWATRDGTAHFRPDIYRKDASIIQTAMVGGWETQTTAVMP